MGVLNNGLWHSDFILEVKGFALEASGQLWSGSKENLLVVGRERKDEQEHLQHCS